MALPQSPKGRYARHPNGGGNGRQQRSGSISVAGWWPPSMSVYLVCIAFVVLVGKVGDMLGPLLLVKGYPRLLLLLNANDLHCVFSANEMSAIEWFPLACTRRIVEDPLFYMMGRHHGDKAVEWLKRKIPAAAKAQAVLEQASCVAVAVDPGVLVCTMAGVNRMPVHSFFLWNFVGTMARLVAINVLSRTFPSQVEYVTSMVRSYQTLVLIGAIFVVSCTSWKFVNFRD